MYKTEYLHLYADSKQFWPVGSKLWWRYFSSLELHEVFEQYDAFGHKGHIVGYNGYK